MDAITRIAVGVNSEETGRVRFRKARQLRPPADFVDRQARITLLAFRAFSSRDEALHFLNSHDSDLDGRPVDLAGQDEDGLSAAMATLRLREATTKLGVSA